MTPSFEHRQSAHCESGATANLLHHQGANLSEAMIFGIGGGLFFGYLPFIKVNHLPLVTYRSFPGKIFAHSCQRLGVEFKTKTYRNKQRATEELEQLLSSGTAVGAQVGVYWLPYFPPALRFHFNAHSLVIYGQEDDQYLISDSVFEGPLSCDKESFLQSRFAPGQLTPKGKIFYPLNAPDLSRLKQAALGGIHEINKHMIKIPFPYIGVRGMRKMASHVATWPDKIGEEAGIHNLGQIIRMQEEIGSGGGGFRFIFACFLKEIAPLFGLDQLDKLGDEMTEIGDTWREFALRAARVCKGRPKPGDDFANLSKHLLGLANQEEDFFKRLLAVEKRCKKAL